MMRNLKLKNAVDVRSCAEEESERSNKTKRWNKSVESFEWSRGRRRLSFSLADVIAVRPKECLDSHFANWSQFLKRPRFAPSREIGFFAAVAAAADACVSCVHSSLLRNSWIAKKSKREREKSPTGMCPSGGWYWWTDSEGPETISRCFCLEQDFVSSQKLSAEKANAAIVISAAFPKRKFLDRCRHGRD